MEINIDVADLDKFIKEKFMECALGKHIKDTLQKSVDELFKGYRNPVEEFVKTELKNMVKEYMNREDIKPKLLIAIGKGLSDETIELIVSNAAHELQNNIKNRDY